MEEGIKSMAKEKITKKKKIRRKRVASIISLFGSICFLSASIFFLYQTSKEIYTMVTLKKEYAVNEETLASLKEETNSLQNEKTKLEDPKYVVRYARGQYLLTKNGEKIFYLPSKE